jgi:hypothetical protein
MIKSTKTNMQIELKHWVVPGFASSVSDHCKDVSFPVRDLPQAGLDTLAKAWLDELYDKAGKPNPFTLPESV